MSHKINPFALALLSTFALAPAGYAAAQSAGAAPGGSNSVSEVVVTAQKRSERLVNVPVSVVAVSGEGLQNAGVTNLQDLATVAPGLRIDMSGSFIQPSIRGVGTAIAAFSNPNVATYVDGVYHPDTLTNNFDFIDIASVQVLKGPQGTLFGRGTTGGAVLITTKDPSFTPHMEAKVGFGSFDTGEAEIFATGPITDKLAGSIVLGTRISKGWIYNDYTGRSANPSQNYTFRGKLLWQPVDFEKLTLTVDYFSLNDPTQYAVNAYNGWTDSAFIPGVPVIVGSPTHVNVDAPIKHRQEGVDVELKSVSDLGFATLTSLSSGQWSTGSETTDEDATSAAIAYAGWNDQEHTFSQEFDLGHSGGALDWVTGLYYYNDKNPYPNFYLSVGGGPAVTVFDMGSTAETYAGFADATYNWDNWHFTLGGRLTEDTAGVFFRSYADPLIGIPASGPSSAHTSWGSFTPRAVVRYSLTPDSNVYVSFSKGDKAGIYNPSGFLTQTTPVAPEQITDWEGGYKVAKHSWSLETSAFHYDYKNMQVSSVKGCCAALQNAASSELYGADLNFNARIEQHWRLNLGVAYTHSKYNSFPKASVYNWCPAAGDPTTVPGLACPAPGVLNGPNTLQNVTGYVLQRAPEWSGDITLGYNHPAFGGVIDLNANYSYQTRASFDFNSYATQGAYGLLSLRAAWTDPSGRWTASIVGKNVTDERYLVQVLENNASFGATWGEPASVMAYLDYKY